MIWFLLLSMLCVGVLGQQNLIYCKTDLTWTEAQAYCRLHHTDLVIIENVAENTQITCDSWLGLYRDNSSAPWKWSNGNELLLYFTWEGNKPQDDENCVYKQAGDKGPWRRKKCDENHPFYCFDETLVFVKERKTWEKALLHCRSMEVITSTLYQNHSYDLASLITPNDTDHARGMIQGAETDRVWTGLRFLGDQWMWVGGEEAMYGNIDCCPNIARCGSLEKSGSNLYSIRDCDEQSNFLCYKRPLV